MDYIIKKMDELAFEDNPLFGNKIAYLAEAKKRGLRVQDGFCVCIKIDKTTIGLEQLKKDIQSIVEKMWDESKRYIVRSSSQYEDRKRHVFPGVFKSKRNISTKEELIIAIEECYNSAFSSYAQRYREIVGADKEKQTYFGVLVQEQIQPKYSGVLFTEMPTEVKQFDNVYHVEMVSGHCQNMLQGKAKAHTYVLRKISDVYRIQESFEPIEDRNEEVEKVLQQLGEETEKITRVFGDNLDIEWGYIDGNIVVFQIRPICDRKGFSISKKRYESIANGLKAEAMKKFQQLGMFSKRLLIVEAEKNLKEILEEINCDSVPDTRLTVRFSYKNQLGLPRCFSKNKKGAIDFIRKMYCEKWAILLYESIEVIHSYELYLDKDKMILEHIPGMWESDVQTNTDVWLWDKKGIKAYMYKGERIAKYENAEGVEYKKVTPYTKAQALSVFQEIKPFVEIIRKNWSYHKGLNFHFVSDKEGEFYFFE